MRLVLVYDSNNHQQDPNSSRIIQSFHEDVNQAITAALKANGHAVSAVEANRKLEARLSALQPDFAFNCSIKCLDDPERAFAPKVLKKLGIPFTGSGACACCTAYSKADAKHILREADIRTPRSLVIRNLESFRIPRSLCYPLFVKPVKGGCSFGIGPESLIPDESSLRERLPGIYAKVGGPLLLEEFLPGREFTAGVLGNRQARVLPIMEFRYKQEKNLRFRSYSLKMVHYENEVVQCPAELEPERRTEIKRLALETYHAIGCRDYARVDLRLDSSGRPCVLEVNALPNLMPEISSFACMAKQAGLSFRDLIGSILRTAAARYSLN
jgi:D-alanine-D-alanine ligase